MEPSEIETQLRKLDGRGSDEEYMAVKILSALGDEFPALLLKKYRDSSKWGERVSCVYHAIKYAKSNDAAYQLGVEAIKDKSKKVRYRACMLLAVAQRQEAISSLESLSKDSDSKEDARAAIDSIKHKNHNFFADRKHSGKVTLYV